MIIFSGFLFFIIVFAGGAIVAAVIFGISSILSFLSVIPENAALSFSQAFAILDVIFPALVFAGVLVIALDKLGLINIQSIMPAKRWK